MNRERSFQPDHYVSDPTALREGNSKKLLFLFSQTKKGGGGKNAESEREGKGKKVGWWLDSYAKGTA